MKNSNAQRLQMPLCRKELFCEISNDFTLPDYLPEIRRIISVRGTPLPPAKYVSSNVAELCGGIDYQLLYVSSEGELASAPFSSEYEFSMPLENCADFDLGEGIMILADVCEAGITTRVTSPRRLNIKCRLGARAAAYGTMVIEEEHKGECDEDSVERLEASVPALHTASAFSEEIALSADIARDTQQLRVIDATAQIISTSLTGGDGFADCHGNALVTLLVADGGAPEGVSQINQKIPFDVKVEGEDFTQDANYRARGYLNNLEVSVDENGIGVALAASIEVIAQRSVPVSYTKDLYSTRNTCETAYRSISIPAYLRCFDTHFSQSERITLEEGNSLVGSQIIHTLCRPTFESTEYERGKAYICGHAKYVFVLLTDGEYSVADMTCPIRFECDCESAPTHSSASLGVITCTARVDGASLAIDSELYLSLQLSRENTVRMVSEARFGDGLKKESGDMIICYPRGDESLWSVSKKYSVPVLKRTDRDAEASLAGVDYLVINL